jgi:ATP-binding cassette subfamily B protein
VVKLLFRLFEPTAGDIFVDGVNLNLLGKDTRRSLFAIVPQEPALFNTSIGENIRFGKPDATKAEIEHAAKLASIDTYIQGLPEKYDTVVGERGVKLSGGEKQRLAIARAIIRDPKVLVFDEATSSLDSHSEQEIQKALDTVAEGRTTITVSHRLSNIANSDMIYVLKEGKVAEQGTHTQLLGKDGVYAHLWKLQIEKSRVTD